MKIKANNKLIRFVSILMFVILFTFMLFPNHYATDTYNIIELGFKEYAEKWFAPSGRTVGMLVLFIFEKTNLNCNQYIFIMKIISVIIATITIFEFHELISKYSNVLNENKFKRLAIFLASLLTFLNSATYQFFYYPESAIMWLGVFFVVIALKIILDYNDKFRYLKSFIFIFLAMNCYQTVILFYIPALMIFVGLTNKSTKEVVIEYIKNCFIICINLLLGYFIIERLCKCFDVIIYRNHGFVLNKDVIITNFFNLIYNFNDGIANSKLFAMNIMVISFCIMLAKDNFKIDKKKSIIILLITIFTSFIEVLLIVSLTDFYLADRIQFTYISLIGLNSIYLLMYTDLIDREEFKKIINYILAFLLVLNILNSISITIWSNIARKRDIIIGNIIAEKIEEYENQNEKIIRIEYCYDSDWTRVDKDIRYTWEPTQRIMGADWVVDNAIRFFSGSDFIIEKNQSNYQEIFDSCEWDEFSEEQIKFKNDTMYFCIY